MESYRRSKEVKNKKERLKKIVREELGNTVNEKFDFSNIANVELAMPGDPDLLDLGPIPRSYKVYKVTLGNQGLYFYLKHFSDKIFLFVTLYYFEGLLDYHQSVLTD